MELCVFKFLVAVNGNIDPNDICSALYNNATRSSKDGRLDVFVIPFDVDFSDWKYIYVPLVES